MKISAFLVLACSSDYELLCVDEVSLSTFPATNVTRTSATLNGAIVITPLNCDTPSPTSQGFVYSTEIQPTLEDIQVNVNGTNISTTIEGLVPNTTYYVRSFLTNNLGDFYGNEIDFTTEDNGGEPTDCDVVYLDANGVTIKACESANIGDVGTINGVEYTVVDREMLDQMLLNEEDVTKVCTTRITDLSYMTINTNNYELYAFSQSFNQDISSWDVSNVTDMNAIFSGATSFLSLIHI